VVFLTGVPHGWLIVHHENLPKLRCSRALSLPLLCILLSSQEPKGKWLCTVCKRYEGKQDASSGVGSLNVIRQVPHFIYVYLPPPPSSLPSYSPPPQPTPTDHNPPQHTHTHPTPDPHTQTHTPACASMRGRATLDPVPHSKSRTVDQTPPP
jgi:hypothetical protein